MAKKLISLVAFVCFVGVALPGATRQLRAQAPSAPYPAAAPLSQYLIPGKASEIELARSAAPASISHNAEVLVLTQDGYMTAVKGGNGFVCLVERAWAKTTDDPEFWNPKISAPHCLNAPAAKTMGRYVFAAGAFKQCGALIFGFQNSGSSVVLAHARSTKQTKPFPPFTAVMYPSCVSTSTSALCEIDAGAALRASSISEALPGMRY